MTVVQSKVDGMTVFNKEHVDTKKQPMFFGAPLGVQRYDSYKYPTFEKLTTQMLGYFWRPEEVSLQKDRGDYQRLKPEQKHIYTSNLKYQILLDSVQGRGPGMAFMPYCSIPDEILEHFKNFLSGTGAIIETMKPEYHDKILAITSHLPHLIAYTIVGTATDLEDQTKHDVVRFSATGFRDFTRIASSDPIMWRDVFLNNKDAVLEMLQRFSEDLTYLQRAIRWSESDKLVDLFTKTREIRRSIIEEGQDQ